jgi:hypothetical protein
MLGQDGPSEAAIPVMQKYFEKLPTMTVSPGAPSTVAGEVPYTSP